ncbi:hypothetical protein [Candidatus Poriferisodalis sp.]|uniref:hypothetical protein n=1 Tax=Candidatus Poriferisodalis sp. TaxID=3101277 RepID=UPI003B01D551
MALAARHGAGERTDGSESVAAQPGNDGTRQPSPTPPLDRNPFSGLTAPGPRRYVSLDDLDAELID